jgi:site-specific recombinase XerC
MPDEIRKLFDVYNLYATVGARWAALLSFALETGARLNEMVTLIVSQVNLDLHRANVIGKGNEERVIRFGDRTVLATCPRSPAPRRMDSTTAAPPPRPLLRTPHSRTSSRSLSQDDRSASSSACRSRRSAA